MESPDLGGVADLATSGSVLTRVTLQVVGLDLAAFLQGVRGCVNGLSEACAPRRAGSISVSIPVPSTSCGAPIYLSFSSEYDQTRLPIVPMLRVPFVTPGCGQETDLGPVHVTLNDFNPLGIRNTIARELAAHGDIPATDGESGAIFNSRWGWALGRMFRYDRTTMDEAFYAGGTVEVVAGDPRCKLVYVNRYRSFRAGTVTSYLDFAATRSTGGFLLFCPKDRIGDPLLRAAGFKNSQTAAPASFADITVPLMEEGMSSIDWDPVAF